MRTFTRSLLSMLICLLVLAGCDNSPTLENSTDPPETDSEVGDSDADGEEVREPRERPEGARDHSSEVQELWVTEVAGPFSHPWSLAFLPDGRKLVTERQGRLFLIEDGEHTEVSGLPSIRAQGQGGLLEVSLHPQFEENGWVYMTYSKPETGSQQTATAVARARLEGTSLTDLEEIFVQDRYSGAGRHYGSRIVWLEDGTFLVSVGDRGSDPPRAQDTEDHAGSVLRLNDDGSVPADNPFVGDDAVLDEIFTVGNRNIQAMALDASAGRVWAADHGPRGGDILYALEAGNNYGWPIFTYGMDYRTGEPMDETETQNPDELEEVSAPFHRFDPSHPPSGLAIVQGGYFDAWQGNIIVGGLRTQELRRLVIGEDGVEHEEALLTGVMGRVRDVRQGPDGAIYVLPDMPEAMLFRIEAAE